MTSAFSVQQSAHPNPGQRMDSTKWPTYDPAAGNVFRWILDAAAKARENQQQRRDAETQRIEDRIRSHGHPQDPQAR